jgi:hypothetical protein
MTGRARGGDSPPHHMGLPLRGADLAYQIVSFVVVGALWGCTNPLLKQATDRGREEGRAGGAVLKELGRLARAKVSLQSPKAYVSKPMGRCYTMPACPVPQAIAVYLINQCGSLVYYILLGSSGTPHGAHRRPVWRIMHSYPSRHVSTDISLSTPICNSLTFVFTALTSHLLGERCDEPVRMIVGVTLVLVGITLCVASKLA